MSDNDATRRDFLRTGAILGAGLLAGCSPNPPAGTTAAPGSGMAPAAGTAAGASTGPADVTIRIAPVLVELKPGQIISTVGYNGSAPGPIIRLKEGKPVSVEVDAADVKAY